MRAFTPVMSGTNKLIVRIIVLLMPVICLWASLAPTTFAQKTYVIADGNQKMVYTAYETDPAQILQKAGVELERNDIYTTVQTDGVYEIRIQRNQRIVVVDRGERMTVNS